MNIIVQWTILYKAATTWLQQELSPAVHAQKEVTISDDSLKKIHKLCFCH